MGVSPRPRKPGAQVLYQFSQNSGIVTVSANNSATASLGLLLTSPDSPATLLGRWETGMRGQRACELRRTVTVAASKLTASKNAVSGSCRRTAGEHELQNAQAANARVIAIIARKHPLGAVYTVLPGMDLPCIPPTPGLKDHAIMST